MVNSVAGAKLSAVPENCTIDDIELTEKGVHSVWSVDSMGDAQDHIEDYLMEAL